jgi:hypothetical protein
LSWLDRFSVDTGLPKSRLLEEGLRLLQQKVEGKKQSFIDMKIEAGIDRVLASEEDQVSFAESSFDKRIGEEML